jgi:hypothetical protein
MGVFLLGRMRDGFARHAQKKVFFRACAAEKRTYLQKPWRHLFRAANAMNIFSM